jgi:hypothetical protein
MVENSTYPKVMYNRFYDYQKDTLEDDGGSEKERAGLETGAIFN